MAEGGESGGVIRELLASFGFGVDTEGLKKGEHALNEFAERIKHTAERLAALFVVHEIAEFAEANVKAMSNVEHAAARLGISAEQVQSYTYAAKALGLEGESLLNMMGRLQVTQQQAGQGSAQAAKAFSQLGVSTKDAVGKSKDADALFTDVAEAISKQKDASKQAAIVTSLFGRSGRELLPLLKEGKEGLADLKEEFKALGGGYSEDAIAAAKKYEHQAAKLSLTLTVLKSKVMETLLPVLVRVAKAVQKVVVGFSDLIKNSNIVQATLAVLTAAAAAFGIQMAIANAPLLIMAAAIAGLIIAVDDFITLLHGGDSLIGRTIDRIFGKDARIDAVKSMKNAWQGVKDVFAGLAPLVEKLIHNFEWFEQHVGAIGDAVAKFTIKAQEKLGFVAPFQKGAVSKGTYEEGVIQTQAEKFAAASAHGATGFKPTEIPAAFKGNEAGFLQAIIAAANQGVGPRLPSAQVAVNAQGMPSIEINQTINASPGMDEKQVGEHAAKKTREVLKQERREAASRLQRKPAVAQ